MGLAMSHCIRLEIIRGYRDIHLIQYLDRERVAHRRCERVEINGKPWSEDRLIIDHGCRVTIAGPVGPDDRVRDHPMSAKDKQGLAVVEYPI